jgi:hypothetical protein
MDATSVQRCEHDQRDKNHERKLERRVAQGDANAQTDEHRQKTEDIPEPSPISQRLG